MKQSNNYSKKFNDFLENLYECEGYDYQVIVTSSSKTSYSGNENQIISSHIAHIASDYQAEGFETVAANGYINDDMVIAELVIRRRSDTDELLYC